MQNLKRQRRTTAVQNDVAPPHPARIEHEKNTGRCSRQPESILSQSRQSFGFSIIHRHQSTLSLLVQIALCWPLSYALTITSTSRSFLFPPSFTLQKDDSCPWEETLQFGNVIHRHQCYSSLQSQLFSSRSSSTDSIISSTSSINGSNIGSSNINGSVSSSNFDHPQHSDLHLSSFEKTNGEIKDRNGSHIAQDTSEQHQHTDSITGTNADTTSVNNASNKYTLPHSWQQHQLHLQDEEAADVPRPTDNGGYTHTNASKAKISAANKGKTPWNKGKARSDEVRARIAAGVKARNRQRFLDKLNEMGLTEAEYEEQQADKKRAKERAKQARRTAKGGYRPTEETRQKISQILKEKYANGEMKPRSVDPAKVRRGFTHSEETRRKISESLRRIWANDDTYRINQVQKASVSSSKVDVRRKISESLKLKWQDPDFRSEMLEKIATRNQANILRDGSYRERISQAMKAKWQEEEYRSKTLASIAKRKTVALPQTPTVPSTTAIIDKKSIATSATSTTARSNNSKSKSPSADILDTTNVYAVQPLQKPKVIKSSIANTETKAKRKATSPTVKISEPTSIRPAPVKLAPTLKKVHKSTVVPSISLTNPTESGVVNIYPSNSMNSNFNGNGAIVNGHDDKIKPPKVDLEKSQEATTPTKASTSDARRKKKDDSVSRLREERRDLYDLLYGDEDDEVDLKDSRRHNFELDDEDLERFDPYGLKDF